MEGTDVLARVIASSTATWDGRDRDNICGRRNDGSVGAILEDDAVTPVIVGVVCLEVRGVKCVILSRIANSASLLSLYTRCDASSDCLLTSTLLLLLGSAFVVSTPVAPPGLVNIASGSFTANLEIAAICDHDGSGRSNVTRRNRNFWDSNIFNWSFRDHSLVANYSGMRNAFLLTRSPASTEVSSHVALA